MTKKNKKRVRRKKAPKKKQKNKNISSSRIDISGPVYTQIENPFKDISPSDMNKILNEIGNSSQNKLKNALKNLDKIIREYDPILLISIISTYGLSIGVGDDGVNSVKKPIGIEQSYVEFLQAKILQLNETEIGTKPANPSVVQTTIELLKEINYSFSFSRMNSNVNNKDESQKAIALIQEHIRGHTQIVRNWGYHSQLLNISKELYGYFDEILLDNIGYRATDIIDIFQFMLKELEKRITLRFNNIQELFAIKNSKKFIHSYYKLIGLGTDKAEEFILKLDIQKIKRKELQVMILSHYDLFLSDIYFFDPIYISMNININKEQVLNIIKDFSFSIGELKNNNEDYFFLDNPIWLRPVIKVNSEFFCPMPQLFFSFILRIMDSVIENISKESLKNRRAKFLEKKIKEIVKRRFPAALTISGLKWNYEGKRFETDLITFIDSHAIIIEAKSHKITDPALRGAPDRIKKHIQRIIVEPANQSWRLQQKFTELRNESNTSDDLLKELPVDIKNIYKIVRISVSLEDFATLQSNLRIIEKTGWLPYDFHPCPTMNLADFETLFDFLEHPVQIIHYLTRRQEIEREFKIQGDELDYMGFYKDTLFNLGIINGDSPSLMSISGMSKDLDYYYESRDEGIQVDKPTPKISPMFSQIFKELENRGIHRWTEIGTILNLFSPDIQIELEKAFKRYKYIVQKSWRHEGHKNIIIAIPPHNSNYALAIVLFKDGNKQKKRKSIDHAASSAFENKHITKCVVIAKNIDHPEFAYHFIGLLEQ